MGMKHKVNIHNGYAEWEEAKDEGLDFRQLFGKYHHIFWTVEGKISLIKLKGILYEDSWYWEIYCIEGDLFEYTERFDTKKEAMGRIEELLC